MLENETFLSELTNFFAANRDKGGSLYITLKRYDGRTKPTPQKSKTEAGKSTANTASSSQPVEHKCLIRAHLGKRKISTVVNAKDVNKFQLAYSNLLKGNFYGLKKRVKKKVGIDK
ncbi:Signal recognition particle protein-like protein [Leptotrombidium deliense]|uniref:Signal recognition particle 14 kDa protein n=1 Tax=Leptotrombidium deliense TaxID=299467 RepID=A0A443S7W0_9ACAR|nr:Signal recognition particle protein-like protein [Leptotrombidium deliense]